MTSGSERAAAANPGGLRLAAIWSIIRLVWRASADSGGGVASDRASVGVPILRLATACLNWRRRRAELRSLQRLDDHMLKDIGVSRCDVERQVRAGWFGE
jgi:uncharacterized protein YjiS (DUF1127 family)